MTSRRLLAVVAIVLVATVGVVGIVTAAGAGRGTGDAGNYTLAELKQDGRHYSVTGARIVPAEQRVYWLERRPVNQPWRQVSKSSSGEKFGSGDVLQTNTVYLRTIRARTSTETVNVTAVFWNKAERTVVNGNTTKTVPYAANVTVRHYAVSLGPGWSLGEIQLPKHSDSTRVTMWLDAHPDAARWVFSHKSAATTLPMNVDTWGEFIVKVLQFVGLPVVVGGAVVGKSVRNAVESAGIGPQWGFGRWFGTITLLTIIAAYTLYTQLAQAIVYVPYLLGGYLVAIMGAYILATHRGDIRTKLLLQPEVANVESFAKRRLQTETNLETDGGEATGPYTWDIQKGEDKTIRAVHDEDGGMSIVKPGFGAFLARIWGARARIENIGDLQSRFQLQNSDHDEVFLVDPGAEEIVHYEAPGFGWDIPEYSWKQLALRGGIVAAFGILTHQLAVEYGPVVYGGAAIAGGLAVAKYYVTATDGYAYIEAAPSHFRQAFGSMVMLTDGIREANELEEAKRKFWKERLTTRAEAQKEQDDFGRTLIEHLSGEDVDDVFEDISDERGADPLAERGASGNGHEPPGEDGTDESDPDAGGGNDGGGLVDGVLGGDDDE